MPPVMAPVRERESLFADLAELDLSIDETVFASPGEDSIEQPQAGFTTVGTSCWSCQLSCDSCASVVICTGCEGCCW